MFYKAFAMLTIIILLVACSGENQPTDGNTPPTSTPYPTAPAVARPTYVVQRGTVQNDLTFTGRWQPRDQMKLSFPIDGTIRQVNVQRGDQVSVGQLLADYQIDDLEDQLDSLQLDLNNALASEESGVDDVVAAVEDAEIGLANQRLSLQSSEVQSPWVSVSNAKIALDDAQRALDNAQRNYDDIVSRPESSASAVDSAYQQLQNAKSSLLQAQNSYFSAAQSFHAHQISIQQQENSVLQAELNLDRARNQTPSSSQNVQSIQLQIDQLKEDIAKSSLYAPLDGIVLEVTISPGTTVQAFEAVMTIGIPDPLEVTANLAFSDTQELSIGLVGVCQVVNQPDTAVQCAVRQIPLSARDADQTTRVAASLDNVAMNQLVEVRMPLEVRENTLWLPPAAIRTFQNRTFVVIETADGPRSVDIQLGLRTTERVEILSGVDEGDVVVGP